jgi:anti-sigma B factor antagonist
VTTLTVTHRRLPGSTLVRVTGEVDATTSAQLEAAIGEARRLAGPLILDLEGLTFLDSGGLAVLLRAHNAAERDGHGLYLAAPQHRLIRILDITGARSRLRVHATVEQAIAVIGGGDWGLAEGA